MAQVTYTVFTLENPREPGLVRYVGITTQSLEKRLSDMAAASQHEPSPSFRTLISGWFRLLKKAELQPVAVRRGEFTSRVEACLVYKDLIEFYAGTTMLLNAVPGPGKCRPVQHATKGGASGRTVNQASENAERQAKRKAKYIKFLSATKCKAPSPPKDGSQ